MDLGEDNPALSPSELKSYAATWDGHAELFTFDDGSDRVRITLDEQGQGILRLGERELFPPATDPDVFYPPAIANMSTGTGYTLEALAGVEYAIQNAHIESERLRLGASQGDTWDSYCALQTTYLLGDGTYSCVASTSYVISGDTCYMTDDAGQVATEPTACAKVDMCQNSTLCDCTVSLPQRCVISHAGIC